MEVLAHEAAHVVQQSRGGAPPCLSPNSPTERGAAEAASQVASATAPVAVSGASAPGLACQMAPQDENRTKKAAPKFDGVTTYSMSSKQRLTKAGYRFARQDGSFD